MNVVMIICDSWRWDYLGCYGNDWIKTPNLDKLASEGTMFKYCYSEGLPTVPTRTTFFTGRYTFPFRGWQRIEPKDVLLAEILWNKGVDTAMVTDVYHLHKPSMAFERGFDYTKHVRGHEGDPWIIDKKVDVAERLDEVHKESKGDKPVKSQTEQYLRNVHWWEGEEDTFVARVMQGGVEWLKARQEEGSHGPERPFLLWLDSFDPHEPWDPPEPYRSMYINPEYKGKDIIQPIPGPSDYLSEEELQHVRDLYAGKISLCDKWVGWLMDQLTEMDLMDDTMIIFTTDHGEPFGDHGYLKKAEPGLYDDLTRIPLIVRHPKGIGAGKTVDALVETTEIFPTVLEAFGVKKPPKAHGESLVPLMAGEKDKIRDYAYMGYFKQSMRVSDHKWAFHMYQKKGKAPELYDWENDPEQLDNVIDKHPEKAMELELELRRFIAGLK
jgi:arylsulfatase A-like enzyme